jgi:hypothetical protein
MPKRIPTMSIVMHLDGKRTVLKPNKTYELTAAQIKEIEETGGKGALRKTVNEESNVTDVSAATGGVVNAADSATNLDASVPAPKGAATSPTTGKGNPKPAPAKGDTKAGSDDDL